MAIALRGLHQELRPYAELALDWARYYGIRPEITSVFRTWEDQERLYQKHLRCVQQGRFGQAPDCLYPANEPGDSAHGAHFAWDSWVPDEDMPLWIEIRRNIGWHVPQHDNIHAALPDWRQYV